MNKLAMQNASVILLSSFVCCYFLGVAAGCAMLGLPRWKIQDETELSEAVCHAMKAVDASYGTGAFQKGLWRILKDGESAFYACQVAVHEGDSVKEVLVNIDMTDSDTKVKIISQ